MGGSVGNYNTPKICEHCGEEFVRPFSKPIWAKTRFCSMECFGIAKMSDPKRVLSEHSERSGKCLVWTGATNKGGYGILKARKIIHLAHRLAWQIANGPIPLGMQICHHCDNPPCIEVAHLFLGTMEDNMNDKIRKGRQSRLRGEKAGSAKLSLAQVRKIRKSTVSSYILGPRHGVHPTTIQRVRSGKSWAYSP